MQDYAYVLVILTAVTFALSLDWSDWFLPVRKLACVPVFQSWHVWDTVIPLAVEGWASSKARIPHFQVPSPVIYRSSYHTCSA